MPVKCAFVLHLRSLQPAIVLPPEDGFGLGIYFRGIKNSKPSMLWKVRNTNCYPSFILIICTLLCGFNEYFGPAASSKCSSVGIVETCATPVFHHIHIISAAEIAQCKTIGLRSPSHPSPVSKSKAAQDSAVTRKRGSVSAGTTVPVLE